MNLKFVKYMKDERDVETKEWSGTNSFGQYHTTSHEYRTYYTNCYISDTNLDTLNTDDKYILSLLKRKAKEMSGNGIIEYIKTVNLSTIAKQLNDFKPYYVDERTYEEKEGQLNGMPCKFNIHIEKLAYNTVRIAYKNSEDKYITKDLQHRYYGEFMNEWKKLEYKDKFNCYDFHELEKNIWKTMYRLKAKGYLDERYVKGSVRTNRRGRYYGVKAKRYYSITEKGLKYLEGLI